MSQISETYNIDCLEYMKSIPDNFFDLAVVDPPYGIGINHSIGRRKNDKPSEYKKAYWDNEPPTQEYFDELFRISKNQIVRGANHFISKMPFDSSCWLMWDKKFSNDVTFAQFELAWSSFKTTCKKFERHPSQEGRIHATQKPVELYKWILQNYAKPGQKIFDSHLGSQSSRIAAWDMGFDFWGCELDEDYFKQGNERFEDHKAKHQTLFDKKEMFFPEQLTLL